MYFRNFELIPIKFEFLKKIKFAPKSDQRHCYYTVSSAKFHQKSIGENLPFL